MLKKTDQQWQAILSPEDYQICRLKGTEPAFSGVYADTKDDGVYRCKCCDTPLFEAKHKYDSGSGWPSFWQPVDTNNIEEIIDTTHGMRRVEVTCAKCGCHLGHVFEDGPEPTGLRFCINSASLQLDPSDP